MQAPVAVCIVSGPDNIVELANKENLQIIGRTSDIVGKPFFEAVPEARQQGFPELLDRVRETGEPFYANEYPTSLLINGKEEIHYYNFVYQPYYENPGDKTASGVFTVSHNVTEQVLARQKAEEVKEHLNFRNVLFEAQNEVTPDGVLIVDAKGKILLYNKRFVETWKMPAEIIDSKDDNAALKHAMTQVVDPQGFINRVTYLYTQHNKPSHEEILFKDGRVIDRIGTPIVAENGLYYGWAWYFRDITDRIKQEQKFRNVLEQASDPILILKGEDLVLEVANEALFELWQVGSEAINKPFLQILPEMEDQVFVDLLHKVLHTGEPFYGFEIPAIFKRKSGKEETLYFNFSYQPYREANSSITGVLVMATDITERVAVKQQLIESEARFRNMVKQSPVAIALTRGRDIVIESINAPMLHMMGKSQTAEDVTGKKMTEVLPEIIDQPILGFVSKVLDTGEPFRGNEVPVTLRVGEKLEEHYFNISYTPLIEEGVITGVLHVAIDVTEQVMARKKIEESEEELKRFKFMADNARDPFILMREDGTFAYLNQKALEAWGFTEEEAAHIRVPDVDPIYQDKMFSESFARAQKEVIPQFETLHKRKDGHIYPVEVNMGGLTLDGKPHLFAVARDITGRKQAEEAIKIKNEQLTRLNVDLDNFIYTASHDLKAPISNIESLLQALLRTLPPEIFSSGHAGRITSLMQESVERFKKTIDNLTDVVKLQKENSGEAVMVDLSEVIREVSLDLEPMIKASGVEVEVDVAGCPAIHFSEKNLRSVIYNLLSNAIKYRSPERVPRVLIHCESTQGYYLLTVKDNGLGMEPGRMSQLFTMFKRFHDHVEGSGIGLYMVKKIAENAGGRIEVESQVGVGSTFRVYFCC